MRNSVFYNTEEIIEVDSHWYDKLKEHALEADQKRARLCLHHSPDDLLHEMIIVFHRDTLIRPHRHLTKTESFHVIFGELDVVLFDERGRQSNVIRMGEFGSSRSAVYRLNCAAWHTVIVRSEFAAIHEVTNGPFKADESDFAPWAPAEPEALRLFLAEIGSGLQCAAN